jgi:hypothetical protein
LIIILIYSCDDQCEVVGLGLHATGTRPTASHAATGEANLSQGHNKERSQPRARPTRRALSLTKEVPAANLCRCQAAANMSTAPWRARNTSSPVACPPPPPARIATCKAGVNLIRDSHRVTGFSTDPRSPSCRGLAYFSQGVQQGGEESLSDLRIRLHVLRGDKNA